MNKKLIGTGAVLVVLVAALLLVRWGKGNTQQQPEDTQEQQSSSDVYQILKADIEDVTSLTVQTQEGNVEYYNDKQWLIKDTDNSVLNPSNVEFNVNALLQLGSGTLITDDPQDLETYGLSEPKAILEAKLTDGSTKTAYLGNATADGNYYYITNDKKNIYTIDKMNGDRILYTPEDFVDMNTPQVSDQSITLVDVKDGDKELYIEYDENDENMNKNMQEKGVVTLSMKKPIENLLVYPYNLQSALLENISQLRPEKAVEIAPKDWEKYGIDASSMTISLKDMDNNAVDLTVGKEADENNYYARFYERNVVFTVPKEAVDPFKEYKIIDFIQKFIALYTRSDVNKVDIASEYGNYTVDFRQEGNNKITQENGVRKDERNTYINNKLVDKDTFTPFYELLTGLTFDELIDDNEKRELKGTITYSLGDGTEDIIHFYDYNENFYVADKGENKNFEQTMLISKQRVKQVVDKAGELSK